ncbi:MAG: SseB family protein [Mycobacteriales bacterium]
MTGRSLPSAGDDGRADPRLATALDAFAADPSPAGRAEVLAAVVQARLFVAVTATSTAEHVNAGAGLRAESSADMALVSMVGAAGERALPAFADVPSLLAWRAAVRPVPVDVTYLCRAALDDGATGVVLDPHRAHVVLDTTDVAALAQGYVPVPGSTLAARRSAVGLLEPDTPPQDELVAALSAALRPERLQAARLLDGPAGLVVGICPRQPLATGEVAALAQRVLGRLGSALPAEGLDLAVVPRSGPGVDLPLRSGWFRRRR